MSRWYRTSEIRGLLEHENYVTQKKKWKLCSTSHTCRLGVGSGRQLKTWQLVWSVNTIHIDFHACKQSILLLASLMADILHPISRLAWWNDSGLHCISLMKWYLLLAGATSWTPARKRPYMRSTIAPARWPTRARGPCSLALDHAPGGAPTWRRTRSYFELMKFRFSSPKEKMLNVSMTECPHTWITPYLQVNVKS